MAQITNQNILDIVSEDMNAANASLLETAPDRFNRYVLNLIQEEIKQGKDMAQRNRHKDPDARIYVHYGRFPVAVYEALSPDFLKELESRDVFIYRKDGLNTAGIRIVFHF